MRNCTLFATLFFLLACSPVNELGEKAVSLSSDSSTRPKLQGDNVGNGGSIIIDGESFQLADLYFKPHKGESYRLSGALKDRLKELEKSFFRWGLQSSSFFQTHIFSELVQYKFVSTLPPKCVDVMEVMPSMSAIQFACTQGYLTWIIPKYFNQLNLKQRAGTILHERLHAWNPQQPHEIIVPFIKGTIVYQSLLEATEAKPTLTAEQGDWLDQMQFAARQLDLLNNNDHSLHAFGGGNFQNANTRLGINLFLSIGSFLSHTHLGDHVNILGSKIQGTEEHPFQIGNSVTISNSHLYQESSSESQVSDGVTLKGVTSPGGIKIGRNSFVKNSFIEDSDIPADYVLQDSILKQSTILEGALVDRAHLFNVTVGPGTKLFDSFVRLSFHYPFPNVTENVVIEGSRLESFANIIIRNTRLNGVTINATDTKTATWLKMRDVHAINSKVSGGRSYGARPWNWSQVRMIDTKIQARWVSDLSSSVFHNTVIKAPALEVLSTHRLSIGCDIQSDKKIKLHDGCRFSEVL